MAVATLIAFAYAHMAAYQQRGGMAIDPGGQLACVMHEPMRFMRLAMADLAVHSRYYVEGLIGRFGLNEFSLPIGVVVIEILTLFAAALTSKRTLRPPVGRVVERHALVGRTSELDELEEAWAESVTGTRRLVLVAGDAGIGKTRLAAELGRRAYDDGASCSTGASTRRRSRRTSRWWRWSAAGRRARRWSRCATRLGVRAADLGILLASSARRRSTEREPAAGHEADAQRLRFFDAVAALLGEVGAGAPLVLVFDDLHWADRPTLQLLRHLVRSPRRGGCCSSAPTARARLRPATRCTS